MSKLGRVCRLSLRMSAWVRRPSESRNDRFDDDEVALLLAHVRERGVEAVDVHAVASAGLALRGLDNAIQDLP